MTFVFCLVSETALVAPRDLHRMAEALEESARHCAYAWRREPPAVVIADALRELPRYACPVVFVDGSSAQGASATHYWTPHRGPAARVFVEQATGLNTGPSSVCEMASHEVNEAIVDPQVNLWCPMPRRDGVQVALEVCDPLQTSYVVRDVDGTDWQCANFVTPAWFDERYAKQAPSGRLFDHAGELQGPGEIGPQGYAVLQHLYSEDRWIETADGPHGELARGKTHAWARTAVRFKAPI